MNVLVLGATGMAGHVVTRYLREQGHFVTEHRGSSDYDLYASFSRERLADIRGVDVIVNCVGMLVQSSMENPDKAVYINGYLPHFLSRHHDRIIHISTDCVFNGKDDAPYAPTDLPNETNMYGRSKAIGELNNDKDLTIRTSIIGPESRDVRNPGLFHWFMSEDGHEVSGWTKAMWNGVTTLELAKFIDRAIAEDITGLEHIGCAIPLSKYEMLSEMKNVYNTSHEIIPVEGKEINKSLVDFYRGYEPKVFSKLLKEQKDWY